MVSHRLPRRPGLFRRPGLRRRPGVPRQPGLLRVAPDFRYLWLSRMVSFTGDGIGRVALVLLAAPAGPEAVSLVLLANTVPRLLGPVAGAIADRVDQRRLMAGCELGQAAIYAAIYATATVSRPRLEVLLPLVAAAGLLATLFSPAGKGSVPRLVPADRLTGANAMLTTAFNLQIVAGPAIGGVLVGLAGTSSAFAADAGTFVLSALLLSRLRALPPDAAASATLTADTVAGLRYAARAALPRALVLGTLVFVSFAAMDNVALVFLVQDKLRGSHLGYGVTVAAFGAGMLAASLLLTRFGRRSRAEHLLISGLALTGVFTALTGLAPDVLLAALAQAAAGVGNTLDLVGTDTLVQRVVPPPLLGRVFGAVSTSAQVGSGIAYAAVGFVVAAAGPRTAFVIAGAGTAAGLAILGPALRSAAPGPPGPVPPDGPIPPGRAVPPDDAVPPTAP